MDCPEPFSLDQYAELDVSGELGDFGTLRLRIGTNEETYAGK